MGIFSFISDACMPSVLPIRDMREKIESSKHRNRIDWPKYFPLLATSQGKKSFPIDARRTVPSSSRTLLPFGGMSSSVRSSVRHTSRWFFVCSSICARDPKNAMFRNTTRFANILQVVVVFAYTSVVTLALELVTLTPSCLARAMMSTRFLEETPWAILQTCQLMLCVPYWKFRSSRFNVGKTYSAAKVRLCMSKSSTSPTLLTRKALWPEGIMYFVRLLDP